MRSRASANSSRGVFCVFLMKACSAISIPSWKPKITRASRLLGSDERISHNPPLKDRHSGNPAGHPNLYLGHIAAYDSLISTRQFIQPLPDWLPACHRLPEPERNGL